MSVHLGYNWYQYELPESLCSWIEQCVNEYVDISKTQPYDTIYVRAKRNLNGKKEFKLVFRYTWNDCENNKEYNFPVCYLLDLNCGKFKGNRMNYYIDGGNIYSEVYPVYNDRFKFKEHSKFNREKRELIFYLKGLDIPEPFLTGHQKRQIERQRKRHRLFRSKQVRKTKHKLKNYKRGRINRGNRDRFLIATH